MTDEPTQEHDMAAEFVDLVVKVHRLDRVDDPDRVREDER